MTVIAFPAGRAASRRLSTSTPSTRPKADCQVVDLAGVRTARAYASVQPAEAFVRAVLSSTEDETILDMLEALDLVATLTEEETALFVALLSEMEHRHPRMVEATDEWAQFGGTTSWSEYFQDEYYGFDFTRTAYPRLSLIPGIDGPDVA